MTKFRIEYHLVSELSVEDLWPEDPPENPTTSDVLDLISEEGTIHDVIREWNLDDDGCVEVVRVTEPETVESTPVPERVANTWDGAKQVMKLFLYEHIWGGGACSGLDVVERHDISVTKEIHSNWRGEDKERYVAEVTAEQFLSLASDPKVDILISGDPRPYKLLWFRQR